MEITVTVGKSLLHLPLSLPVFFQPHVVKVLLHPSEFHICHFKPSCPVFMTVFRNRSVSVFCCISKQFLQPSVSEFLPSELLFPLPLSEWTVIYTLTNILISLQTQTIHLPLNDYMFHRIVFNSKTIVHSYQL